MSIPEGLEGKSREERVAFRKKMRFQYGFDENFETVPPSEQTRELINLRLRAHDLPIVSTPGDSELLDLTESLVSSTREKNRLLAKYLCPADQYIQDWLMSYLGDVVEDPDQIWLPRSIIADRHGLTRAMSLPADADAFETDIIKSYRTPNGGVCHNPKRDRRTTKGVFHIAEGGLPVPWDKKSVPKLTYARLLQRALQPPSELLRLPFTDRQREKAETFVSILLRPTVCPNVPGVRAKKTLEVRFFAPGSMVANLDFVESIFGNAGDPFLPRNDARMDVEHWSCHTGYVILAPHLIGVTKKEVGLPHISEATERQKRDSMCWESENELYNDGGAFKLTARDNRGVMCTMIADNYFGYCKKEVKTMISFSANLYGQCEEEHAGGALVFPRSDLGEEFHVTSFRRRYEHEYNEMVSMFGDGMILQPEGYAVDKEYPDILYVHQNAAFNLRDQSIRWHWDGADRELKLLPGKTYVLPTGYQLTMERPSAAQRWRIIGTNPLGTVCHKPCTVSGGGKSEISKLLNDAMVSGTVYVRDFHKDFDLVEELLDHDKMAERFAARYRNRREPGKASRPILSHARSLGSVIKMLNENPLFTDEYNAWLNDIPRHIRDLVLVVKRFYKDDWGTDWRWRFSVDSLNGMPGRELKFRDQVIITQHLRVGFASDGSWRTFSLRKDFMPATKIQTQDDITASVVIPTGELDDKPGDQRAYKYTANCEHRLFQRPDDAIHRGYDKTTENDFARSGAFFSNYQPLHHTEADDRMENVVNFDQYTEPMQGLIKKVAEENRPDYFVLTSDPRLMDGTPTKNPRYLQNRPDLVHARTRYLAEIGVRMYKRIPFERPVLFPVHCVLPGRRHNPPDEATGIRALAVFNPIHYQELPELFMDYIASLTGKSPSTTGAGSEGALTKAPFNALPPIVDLNNALVAYLLTGLRPLTTAAGYVGPKVRVDHDVSMLIPELISRMTDQERDPKWLVENGYMDKIPDFEHNGRLIMASRLGYRINERFVDEFLGRLFSNPGTVFSDEMMKPELQGETLYLEGLLNIMDTMKSVAQNYFDDGSIDHACPPLKALLHIMAHGDYEGKDVHHPEIRDLFDADKAFASEWYKERLLTRQRVDAINHRKHIVYLEQSLAEDEAHSAEFIAYAKDQLAKVRAQLANVETDEYLKSLNGSLGTDPYLWG